ncbi:beta-ketoacyl-[acyl-carrier-protein] synthase family protein [Flavobacteriaceae bacterium F89]|uniref:3-oxoacyl-[acyl-carrier-protein] synthase 1 n=1 Tax=Cerina litoralis TaxID=2874477 RepID=A0AAE3EUR7_9FLAO|nr:beta-ketoacyl-[acyl-carrier-protein] synthase family protein [Cerina litoralis]MCG2461303.1 beta-ketoacyl-[acyl-carrier-protein] synthase family protein [Cerina litoralis]
MHRRVVVTGLGVCAPNGVDLETFAQSLKNGTSGIAFHQQLADLNFSCQIAGKPPLEEAHIQRYFSPLQLKGLNSSGIIYGVIAGTDAWKDAGLSYAPAATPDWDSGIIFGAGIFGVDKFKDSIYTVDSGNVRRLGSTAVVQVMASGVSVYLGSILGCGNQVTTNSSACSTGTEGILLAYDRIRSGKATRMLTGSTSDHGPYVWGGFDSMRILPTRYNTNPTAASRPMSATASGFVPGSGAGAMVLESLDSALERGARIYAEVLGGAVNNGGQRGGGTMTAPNSEAVQRCIVHALKNAGVENSDIDTINGHLTATSKDSEEISNWAVALDRSRKDFPYINSFKGVLGHCLAAAGSIEGVGAILQFREGQVFGNVNCNDLDPRITSIVDPSKIPQKTIAHSPEVLAKASFGFGDVNACVIFGAYNNEID